MAGDQQGDGIATTSSTDGAGCPGIADHGGHLAIGYRMAVRDRRECLQHLGSKRRQSRQIERGKWARLATKIGFEPLFDLLVKDGVGINLYGDFRCRSQRYMAHSCS